MDSNSLLNKKNLSSLMSEFNEPSFIERFIYKTFVLYTRKKIYVPFVNKLEINGNENVLEYGPGMGVCTRLVAERLLKKGGSITSLDISENWTKMLKKHVKRFQNVQALTGILGENTFPQDHFDVVFFHLVLHDIPMKQRFGIMENLQRSLKKGGRLIFREPFNPSHGMPVSEIKELMKKLNMKEVWSEKMKYIAMGDTYTAEYVK